MKPPKKPAKKAGKIDRTTAEDVDFEVEGIDGDRMDDIAAEISAQLGADPDSGDWKIKIYRVNGKGQREPWLFDAAIDTLGELHQRIADNNYGSGDYRVRVINDGRVWKMFTIAIEVPPRVAAPAQPDNELMRRFDALEARLVPPAPTVAADPFDNLERLSVVIKNLQPATPAPAAEGTSAEKMMNMLLRGMEMGKEMAGTGGSGGMLSDVASILGTPAVASFIETATSRGAARPAPPPAPGQIVHQPPPPAPAGPQDELTKALMYLLDRARQNKSPEFYAEWLLDNVGQAGIEHILQLPNLPDLVVQLVPQFAEHIGWRDELLVELRQLMMPDPEEPQNAAPHATNGKVGPA